MKVEVELPQFPAIVAGGDRWHVGAGGGPDARGHRRNDGLLVTTVDDDLEAAGRVGVETRRFTAR